MRRAAGAVVVALAIAASACGGAGRETPPISVPESVQGRVTIPEGLRARVCRLAIGGGSGAEVVNVEADVPAAVVLQPGDVITQIDGMPVVESADLIAAVRSRQVGDVVAVRVIRSGSGPIDADIELIEHSDGSGAPMLGIGVRTAVELRNATDVGEAGRLDSPFTAVVSVGGQLYAVDAVEGAWLNLESPTPDLAWVPAGGAVFVLVDGQPDQVVNVADPSSSVDFVAEGWDGRWVLGSQAGRVLVYADRGDENGQQGALFAVDPTSGGIEWSWSPQDSERTDNPIPIFAVSSPNQQRTLVGTAQFDEQGNVEVLRFSLLGDDGEQLLVVPPSGGQIPQGSAVLGWYTDSEVAYQQTDGILLWNVDTGDLRSIELPFSAEGAQFAPVGDGEHFIMLAGGSLDLVSSGASASMRQLAVDCDADQVAPPGFVS
jgi:PDZ domain